MPNAKKTAQNAKKYSVYFEHYPLPNDFPITVGVGAPLGSYPTSGLHFHDCLEIGLCHSGSGVVLINGETFSFSEGDVTIIPNGVAHYHVGIAKSAGKWSWISALPVKLLACFAESLGNLDLEKALVSPDSCFFEAGKFPVIHAQTKALVEQLGLRDQLSSITVRAALAILISTIRRTRQVEQMRPDVRNGKSSSQLERIAPALNLIASAQDRFPSVAELAQACFTGIRSFQILFAKALGKTPLEYMIDFHISMAAAQLRSGSQKMNEISFKNGFNSLSSFNRLFKKRMGITPSLYRAGVEAG